MWVMRMNNMRELRKRSGMKQETVANQLGAKQASISEWESGKKMPSLETAIQLSKIFNVSLGCVVGLEPIPEGYPDHHIQPYVYNKVTIPQTMVAEPERSYRPKKAPFSREQIEFLDDWGNRLKEDIVGALREDSSLLKDQKAE